MKTRFRIKKDDTIQAYAKNVNGKLLSSLYDSGFTTIEQVRIAILRKISYFSGNKIDISITNETEQTWKQFQIKVN